MKQLTITGFSVVASILALTLAAYLLVVQSASAGHNADGLAGYWNFDDSTTPATAFDSSSHSLDGVISGASYSGGGPLIVGNVDALEFDGVDDKVTVADDDELSFGDGSGDEPFSISAWVFMNDNDFPIVSKFGGSPNNEYFFTVTADDRLVLVLYDENGPDHIGRATDDGSEAAFHGSWVHYAATYDGSETSGGGSIKLYRNGVELDTSSVDAGSYTAMHNTATDVEIGRTLGGVVDRAADGYIDEVRLYNGELSADEVAALHDYSNFTVSLTPEEDVNPVGDDHTVTSTLAPALAGIPVLFEVDGANPGGGTPYVYTNGDGEASFTYTGNNAGTDTITGCIDLSDTINGGACNVGIVPLEPEDTATKHWYDAAVYGGGRIQEEISDKRKDWHDISFGGEVYDLGANGLMGDWQVNFHNVGEPDSVDKGKFHGSDITQLLLFDGNTDNCVAAARFDVNGTFNNEEGWSVIIRFGDSDLDASAVPDDTARIELFDDVELVYDTTVKTEFSDQYGCVGNSRTGLDSGDIVIDR